MNLLSVFLIGIALSMDTFSLSLSIGIFNIKKEEAIRLSLIVGVMHFIMPFLGMVIGSKVIFLLKLNADILLGFILIIIALEMFIDIIRGKEEKFNLSIWGMFLFALGVSIDSFSVGLGLSAITSNVYLAMLIFSICSFSFTLLGTIMGKAASKFLGVYASGLGIIILFILGLVHLI